MSVQDHPDYEHERDFLDRVSKRLQLELDDSKVFRHMGADDQSAIAVWKVLQPLRDRLPDLAKEPYFARIDLEGEESTQELYLSTRGAHGLGSDSQVISWTAPAASVYFRYQRPGPVEFQAPNQTMRATLNLKRRLKIEKSVLVDISDFFTPPSGASQVPTRLVAQAEAEPKPAYQLVTESEALLEALEAPKRGPMQPIVETLQPDQYELVSGPIDVPLLIQGVAGSGKTAVALQRLAFVLFPEDGSEAPSEAKCLVLGPSHAFLSYVEQVLPGLGLRGVRHLSWQEWLGERLSTKDRDRWAWSGKSQGGPKNSSKMVNAIEAYVRTIPRSLRVPPGGLKMTEVGATRLTIQLTEEHIRAALNTAHGDSQAWLDEVRRGLLGLMQHEYFAAEDARLQEMQLAADELNELAEDVSRAATELLPLADQSKVQRLLQRLGEPGSIDSRLQNQLSGGLNELVQKFTSAARRASNKVARLKDEQARSNERTLKQISDKFEGRTDSWLRLPSALDVYRAMLADTGFLQDFGLEISLTEPKESLPGDLPSLAADDSLAVALIDVLMKPLDRRFEYVVVDEAQELTPVAARLLREVTLEGRLTLVGDVNQRQGANVSTTWDEITDQIPGLRKVVVRTSYRSTREVTELGNAILRAVTDEIETLAVPFNRAGPVPVLRLFAEQSAMMAELGEFVRRLLESGNRQVAVLCLGGEQAQSVHDALSSQKLSPKLLDPAAEIEESDLVVATAYDVRGMEFDAVVLVADTDAPSTDEEQGRAAYLAVTRALHSVTVCSLGKVGPNWLGIALGEGSIEEGDGSLEELAKKLASTGVRTDSAVLEALRVLREAGVDVSKLHPN